VARGWGQITKRALLREEGIALVLALGFMVVLGITTTTAMYYTTMNQHSASFSHGTISASALAEAALNNAYSELAAAHDPSLPSAVPAQNLVPFGAGTISWSGSYNTTTKTWTLTGTGVLHNPTGGADIVKTVTATAHLGTSTHGDANNAVWNYVYADSLSTCTTLANSVNINVPFYIRGNLCLNNSSQVSGYALQVGGHVQLNNSSHIGANGAPLNNIHIAGGCSRNGGASYDTPCGATDQVYGTTVDNQTANLTKPPVDLASWYTNAAPGPMHGCTTGSFPGGFDNDHLLNASLGNVTLTTAAPYDCKVLDGSGNIIGRLAWTGGSSGTLTVAGTVFIDGSVSLTNSTHVVYQGSATLYVSGTFNLNNSSTVCGIAACDDTWDSSANLLCVVAGSVDGSQTSISFGNSAIFQGALYAVNDYAENNSVSTWGPIIARQLYFQNSTYNHYVPMGTLMPGMPATYDSAVTVNYDAGSWSG